MTNIIINSRKRKEEQSIFTFTFVLNENQNIEFNETRKFYINSHKGHTCAIFVFWFTLNSTRTISFIRISNICSLQIHKNTNIQQVGFTIAYFTFVSPYIHSFSLDPHFTQFSQSAVAFHKRTNTCDQAKHKRNEPKSPEIARGKEKIMEN